MSAADKVTEEKTALSKLNLTVGTPQLRINIEWFRMLARCRLTNEKEHSHTGTEIHFLLSGKHEFYTETDVVYLESMQGVIIPSTIKHRLHNSGGRFVRYVLNISFDEVRCETNDNSGDVNFLKDTLNVKNICCFTLSQQIVELLHECTAESETAQNGYMTVIEADIMKLLTLLARELDTGNRRLYAVQKRTPFSHQITEEAERYIRVHINEKITVSEIAHCLHVSEKQLQRMFIREYNMTIHKMIEQKRLSAVKELLRTTCSTLDVIAAAVGFSSKEGLCRFFIRLEGQTPTQYRKGAFSNEK